MIRVAFKYHLSGRSNLPVVPIVANMMALGLYLGSPGLKAEVYEYCESTSRPLKVNCASF